MELIRSSREASRHPVVALVRALSQAYQAFATYDAKHLRGYGLTQSQADVIFTLGNTTGMSCKELGQHTLITKGTLTGVLDRLEKKGLTRRQPSRRDRRVIHVSRTSKGQRMFEDIFPQHIAYLAERIETLGEEDHAKIIGSLNQVQTLF